MKTVSQLDAMGYFVGSVIADKSPLEDGVFLVPGGAVDFPPVHVPEGFKAKWNGTGFDMELINVPAVEPADPEPVLPLIATKYKFRLALNQLGLREAVETAVAASTDQNIKDAWQYADEFRSDNPLVLQLGTTLGKTEEDIRVVFELANTCAPELAHIAEHSGCGRVNR